MHHPLMPHLHRAQHHQAAHHQAQHQAQHQLHQGGGGGAFSLPDASAPYDPHAVLSALGLVGGGHMDQQHQGHLQQHQGRLQQQQQQQQGMPPAALYREGPMGLPPSGALAPQSQVRSGASAASAAVPCISRGGLRPCSPLPASQRAACPLEVHRPASPLTPTPSAAALQGFATPGLPDGLGLDALLRQLDPAVLAHLQLAAMQAQHAATPAGAPGMQLGGWQGAAAAMYGGAPGAMGMGLGSMQGMGGMQSGMQGGMQGMHPQQYAQQQVPEECLVGLHGRYQSYCDQVRFPEPALPCSLPCSRRWGQATLWHDSRRARLGRCNLHPPARRSSPTASTLLLLRCWL
jgi:hypothetical protein